jgi:hypothetical protein
VSVTQQFTRSLASALVVGESLDALGHLSDSARAKILGLKAAKMFKFDVESLLERRRTVATHAQE